MVLEKFVVELPISPAAADVAGAPACVIERIVRTIGRSEGTPAFHHAGEGEAEPVAFIVHEADIFGDDHWFLDAGNTVGKVEALVHGVKLTPLFPALHPHQAPEGWRPIETAPKDGRSLAVWVADSEITPHVFSPVSITADGGWWDDSIGDRIEPIAGATHWFQIAPPASPSKQASASADQGGE